MSGQAMTFLGALAAMLAFIQVGLPAETPVYLKLAIGAANAGLSYFLGQTNKGNLPPPEQKVTVTVTEPPPAPLVTPEGRR